MERTRAAALELIKEGRIDVIQEGQMLDCPDKAKGPFDFDSLSSFESTLSG